MPSLRDFQKQMEEAVYGETPAGHCVNCKQPFSQANVRTEAGWKETQISKLCEVCWDKLFAPNA
jgi:hypothetical protein